MQHPEIDTGSSDPHWGVKEQTVSAPVPLMIRTEVSHSPGILVSKGNLASHVQANGNGSISTVLLDWKP